MTDTQIRVRSRGVTYQQLLAEDSREVPAVLRRESVFDDGPMAVPVERYTSAQFFELEREKIWDRVWQMACREEAIPSVGDHVVYDIAGRSYLVVRTGPSTIKAFHNVCRHRGRLLREVGGRGAAEFRCPFHGFAWKIDGSLKHVPCEWDFPQIEDPDEWGLREALVGTWGGFVFINPDRGAAPLEAHLGDLGEQFTAWPLEDRFTQVHVAKILRCNWKVAQEAFMEAMHVVSTHPQLLASIGDANTQYDAFGNYSRAMTANGTPSPHLRWEPTQQEILDSMFDRNLDDPPLLTVPAGETARRVSAASRRDNLRPLLGDATDVLSDAEMNDSFYFTVFPNFHPWGSYNRIVYRFRPHGMKVDEAIMECMFLSPFPEGRRPPPVPVHWLGPDDDWTEAPELGTLARVFNQDTFNLPNVQRGLQASPYDSVIFARYEETKIRHFHMLLDQHLSTPDRH
jgi:phenylpropionate dioxygenase-like ring-hydroxylating dioxygenase large terminal subunit